MHNNYRSTGSTGLIEDGDTVILRLAVGDRVRCLVGDLKGINGIVVALAPMLVC